MTTPLLSELREPPVVGRYYMVPTIHGALLEITDDWPVLGALHHDRGGPLNFPHNHYHVDARFLTAGQERKLRPWASGSLVGEPIERVVSGWVIHNLRWNCIGRPPLARKRCRRESWNYAAGHMLAIQRLREERGDPVEPIRRADGRLLCPHRKADLSQFPPDQDGIVTCPLHGLRVRCRAAA